MWLFMPDAFYSIRAYDPEKGEIAVAEPHVQVRARVKADIEMVCQHTTDWFDTKHGHDYRYQLAVPLREWVRYVSKLAEDIMGRKPMKGSGNPRSDVHMDVWNATWGLVRLDEGR